MAFGKTFKTKTEAKAHLEKLRKRGRTDLEIRKLDKRLFPRRTKLFHVGDIIDWLNFA